MFRDKYMEHNIIRIKSYTKANEINLNISWIIKIKNKILNKLSFKGKRKNLLIINLLIIKGISNNFCN